jgi:hypothetical protein
VGKVDEEDESEKDEERCADGGCRGGRKRRDG